MAEQNVVSIFSYSPVFLGVGLQFFCDIADPQKRLTRDNLFQATHYICFVTGHSLVTSKDYDTSPLALTLQKPSYSDRTAPTPTTWTGGDVPLSPPTHQLFLALTLSSRHPRAPLSFFNNGCLKSPTKLPSSVMTSVLPSEMSLLVTTPTSALLQSRP